MHEYVLQSPIPLLISLCNLTTPPLFRRIRVRISSSVRIVVATGVFLTRNARLSSLTSASDGHLRIRTSSYFHRRPCRQAVDRPQACQLPANSFWSALPAVIKRIFMPRFLSHSWYKVKLYCLYVNWILFAKTGHLSTLTVIKYLKQSVVNLRRVCSLQRQEV